MDGRGTRCHLCILCQISWSQWDIWVFTSSNCAQIIITFTYNKIWNEKWETKWLKFELTYPSTEYHLLRRQNYLIEIERFKGAFKIEKLALDDHYYTPFKIKRIINALRRINRPIYVRANLVSQKQIHEKKKEKGKERKLRTVIIMIILSENGMFGEIDNECRRIVRFRDIWLRDRTQIVMVVCEHKQTWSFWNISCFGEYLSNTIIYSKNNPHAKLCVPKNPKRLEIINSNRLWH